MSADATTYGSPFTAACVQLCSGRDMAANIETASTLIREAASQGAQIVFTPETTHLMEREGKRLMELVRPEDEDPGVAAFTDLAKDLGIWLNIGSLAIRLSETQVANRSFLIAPDGSIAATYDKIHMFDVTLPTGEVYRESKSYRPGGRAVLAQTPFARLGLTICYDLRFAGLYRSLAKAGAQVLTVPAAFTQVTGEAHWHVLLRARAIETGCFVVAAAQGGTHENGRETYGHSLIIGPWGEILAEGGTEPSVILAKIDPAKIEEVRGRVPALHHDRDFVAPAPGKA